MQATNETITLDFDNFIKKTFKFIEYYITYCTNMVSRPHSGRPKLVESGYVHRISATSKEYLSMLVLSIVMY